jgi:tetratricopeptide (TPR) repeat protein
MAEDSEIEPAGELENAADTTPSAMAMALDGARHDPGLRDDIRGFLANQNRLIADQRHHLGEQLRHLKLKYFADRLKAVLQVFGVLLGALILSGVGLIVWQAVNDRSLVMEPFGAPPDFTARGLRGEVLAAELLDRLQALDRQSESIRPLQSYRTSWNEDIKIELPDTKVSLGELRGYLRDWLGHPTHVAGDVWRDGSGLRLTVRVGERTVSLSGAEGDLSGLLDRAAEQVFAATEPYRYSKWLERHDRPAEGLAVAQALAAGRDRVERKWALREVCVLQNSYFRFRQGYDACTESLRMEPGNPQAELDRAPNALALQWIGQGVADTRDVAQKLSHPRGDIIDAARDVFQPLAAANVAEWDGDLAEAERLYRAILRGANFQDVQSSARVALPGVLARRHDLDAARAALAQVNLPLEGYAANPRWTGFQERQPEWEVPAAAGDYPAALAALDRYEAGVAKAGDTALRARILKAERARILLLMGRPEEAKALADQTPFDCYACLRVRGKVAAARGDWAGADRWFGEAVRQGPYLSFAHEEWGEARLAHGDLVDAEADLQEASRRAPLWADPLKALGDVAARRGDWRAALQFYDKALALAPAWAELKQARAFAAARLK